MSTDTSLTKRSLSGAAIVLTVLSAVAVSLAVDSFWLQTRIFDTNAVVAAAAPLPKDPVVSTAVATAAAEAVIESDLAEQIEGALPEEIGFLAPTFSDLAASVVFDATKSLVESDAFTAVWLVMVADTHAKAMADLEGTARPSNGVALDLDVAADAIFNELAGYGIDLVGELETSLGEIVLIQADSLVWPNRFIDVFQTGLWVFPLIAALLLAAAVLIDPLRWRSVQVTGFSVAVVMLLSAAGLALARSATINDADIVNQAAVGRMWDAFATGYIPLAAAVGAIGAIAGLSTWWLRR